MLMKQTTIDIQEILSEVTEIRLKTINLSKAEVTPET